MRIESRGKHVNSQDCAWGKQDISKGQLPSPAKLLRLAFHDCVPYIAEDGSHHGGEH